MYYYSGAIKIAAMLHCKIQQKTRLKLSGYRVCDLLKIEDRK
jgi:hypothetical protein